MKLIIVLAVCLTVLMTITSCKGDNKVTDIKKIMKEVPPEYKKQKKVNGIMRDTYFFKDFIGYSHPMQMYGPLTYAETQSRSFGYYEASMDTSGEIPLFIFAEDFDCPERTPITIRDRHLGTERVGDIYYLFHMYKDDVLLDKEVKLDDTFGVNEYIHVVFDESHKIIKSEVVKKRFVGSYEYKYDGKGLLMKVIGGSGKTLERGKDF
jgi:hypothetical protein